MAAYTDALLRGAILVLTSLVLGGVAWLRLVLGAGPHAQPVGAVALALRIVAVSAALAAVAQAGIMLVALSGLDEVAGNWPVRLYLETTFARVGLLRVVLGVGVGWIAFRMTHRSAGRSPWIALTTGATLLVVLSAMLSHGVARLEARTPMVALDALHQFATTTWVGGLAHLAAYAAWGQREPVVPPGESALVRRFSTLAFAAVVTLVLAGAGLTVGYVGAWSALAGTAYGVMILSKMILLAATLGLAGMNLRMVRRAASRIDARLFRYAEVELGLGLTAFFAAASLTALPPAIDVTADRATITEVAARFHPALPRLISPPIDELIRTADPLLGEQRKRKPIERAWSEYNHHWAGLFVVLMGILSLLERLGVKPARHWPLLFLGLAMFLFVRNDPRAWPLGPASVWESFALPDVVQHRLLVLLVVAFGVFEWMVRTRRLPERPAGYVFPLLGAVGGVLLLTHSHAMVNLKEEFLVEISHALLAILSTFVGWGRWLELRLPEAGRGPGWQWRGCLIAVGILLLFYREG